MSAMLGVIETSLARSPMKVLQLEHAGLFTGPNILCFPNGRAAAAIRRFAGLTQQPSSRDPHQALNGARVLLGGVRRSFTASPGAELSHADEVRQRETP